VLRIELFNAYVAILTDYVDLGREQHAFALMIALKCAQHSFQSHQVS
jgi:hypothetical protein